MPVRHSCIVIENRLKTLIPESAFRCIYSRKNVKRKRVFPAIYTSEGWQYHYVGNE